MTNIAQTVNVLQCLVETDGDDAWACPTYRVCDAYAPQKGNEAEAIRTKIDTPIRERSDDAEGSFVSITTLDCRDSHTVAVGIEGKPLESAEASVLFTDHDLKMTVTVDNPEELDSESLDADIDGTTVTVDLPPATVATLDLS